MVEIYKSLPVSGARRLPHRDGSLGIESEDQNKTAAVSVNSKHVDIGYETDEKNSLAQVSVLDHNLIEQLKDQNRLLNEEVLRLNEELKLIHIKHSELVANQSRIEEQHKNKGYEAGFKNGCDKAEREEKDRISAFVSAIEVFNHRLSEDLGVMQKDSVLLAYEALVLIVGEHYKTPEFMKAILESAVSKIVEKRNIKLHLSSADCNLVNQMLSSKVFQLGALVEVVADDRIKKGGCIIETENGMWDARLDSQLERIKDALVITQEGLR
jgi:flagellar assembly protein FliH